MKRDGAMFAFRTVDGNQVYVDPTFVAFVEQRDEMARIVFSGGMELLVRDEVGNVYNVIRAYKQGDQD